MPVTIKVFISWEFARPTAIFYAGPVFTVSQSERLVLQHINLTMLVILRTCEIYILGVRPDFMSFNLLYLHHGLPKISAQWLFSSHPSNSLLVGEFEVPVLSL